MNFSGAVVTSSIVLVCAVLAALAVGVLVAYGVCMAMFGVFQMHVRQVAAENGSRRVVAPVQVVKS
ncbi:MAG TPA: hypothetical protein VK684_03605 [Edaphobacter sp.]|nr:hypothetical protein [Edaphobacter sp.]